MKILAIIPARGGSKGFPNKNIASINGVTLIEAAVRTALRCDIIDDVYISTDSEHYENIAKKAGALSLGLRPVHLATDGAKTKDVVWDILTKTNTVYDYIVLLQPTSPIRESSDIKNMINNMESNEADAAVSVTFLEEPHPYKLKSISDTGYLKPFIDGTNSEIPRQELPKAYALNGALYIVKYSTFLDKKTFLPEKTLPYVMKRHINIDTEEDFSLLQAMHNKQNIKIFMD